MGIVRSYLHKLPYALNSAVWLRLVAEHLSNREIAARLFISRATVKTHLIHVFAKLGIDSRSELAAAAIRRGIQPQPTSRG